MEQETKYSLTEPSVARVEEWLEGIAAKVVGDVQSSLNF
jgi:hypothetical protein